MQERDNFGIADGWWDIAGHWHATPATTRTALRSAMGADEHPDGPPDGTPLWFLRPGDRRVIWSPGVLELDDATTVRVTDTLPDDLPLGVHLLHSDDGHLTRVFSVPGRCRRAARSWGWSVQLPQTRSRSSWGHGDLADLAELAEWSQTRGAAVLAHNPLGAPIPSRDQQPSPYYASSRRFWSPLYLRVEDVPGAELLGDALTGAATAGRALTEAPLVDRDAVWALKSDALGAIWSRVRDSTTVRDLLAASDDDTLWHHARFCALAERHGGGRSTFPADAAHPDLAARARTVGAMSDDVDRWRWIQLVTDAQLAAAAGAGAELLADLAVGFDPDGFDAWLDQDLIAESCRIGAPPDELGPLGQDWGLPPYVPWRLRAAGYAPWLDVLRRVLRHSGLLRIDHVMGLFRLFCIPPDTDAPDGTYVYSHGSELIDIACMEATLAGAILIGEDLGTVEPEVRDAMADRGVYGYRVGWFTDDPPGSWPEGTVAMMTTHDLPTIAGMWSGVDAADRSAAGQPESPEEDALLRSRLVHLAGLGGLDPAKADLVTAAEVTVDAHRALAESGSDLVLATLEDAVGQVRRPNLPGTVDGHPNWCIPLPATIEALGAAGADRLAQTMLTAPRRARGGTPRSEPTT